MQTWLEEIRAILQEAPSDPQESDANVRRASVALILRENSIREPEILFIERSEREDDPWSGQIAFPGGRVDLNETNLQAAIRETFEEVGISLRAQDHLGDFQEIRVVRVVNFYHFLFHPCVFLFWRRKFSYRSARSR